MEYRVKVLRTATIECPDRCCYCGAKSPHNVVTIAARSGKNGLGESIGAPRLKLPICPICALQWRIRWWLMPSVLAFAIPIGMLLTHLLRGRFGLETSSWIGTGFIGACFLIGMLVRGIFMPQAASAGFDEHWIVLGFKDQTFWEEFYELNRESARVTQDA